MKSISINKIEAELADRRPFGDSLHINQAIDRVYLHRLSLAETGLSSTLDLTKNLCCLSSTQCHRFLRDTMFRMGIDQAVLYGSGAPTRITFEVILAILNNAESLMKSPQPAPVLDSLQPLSARLNDGSLSPLIWRPNADAISQSMQELVHEMVPDAHIDIASTEQIEILKAATKLLDTLLPKLAPSALNHVCSIVVVSERETPGLGHRGFGSGTTNNLPGVVVVSASELKTPWRAAEILLHEALHLKFIDLEFTHSMNLAAADEKDDLWTIAPPWRQLDENIEEWPPIRAMTAAHVYVGLSLFVHSVQMLAARPNASARYQSVEFHRSLREAPYRAHFLLKALCERIDSLGTAGQYFVGWLSGLAESLLKWSDRTASSPSHLDTQNQLAGGFVAPEWWLRDR